MILALILASLASSALSAALHWIGVSFCFRAVSFISAQSFLSQGRSCTRMLSREGQCFGKRNLKIQMLHIPKVKAFDLPKLML